MCIAWSILSHLELKNIRKNFILPIVSQTHKKTGSESSIDEDWNEKLQENKNTQIRKFYEEHAETT